MNIYRISKQLILIFRGVDMGIVIKAACGCNVGKIRKNNEDNFYFCGKILPKNNSGLRTVYKKKVDSDKIPLLTVWEARKPERLHLLSRRK